MKTKEEIVQNWLPRYTGQSLDQFGEYILLTNFSHYLKLFSEWNNAPIVGSDRPMPCVTADNITLINFGMGSPTAATVMDLLTAIRPKAVLFLGKCGGLKKRNNLGDLILPIAAIRGEGGACLARFRPAKSSIHHDPGTGDRLLDRHSLLHQPTCLGAR
jgi:AMP nucleosidase